MAKESYAINDEIKLLFLKALITDRDFINELIDAAGDNDPEEEFKKTLIKNGFSSQLSNEIAEFNNNKLTKWHLNLEKLATSDIHKFLPEGIVGYY